MPPRAQDGSEGITTPHWARQPGTALIYNGVLIPNTELGHIILSAKHLDAEKYASSAIRENEELGYKKWAKRLTKYYGLMEKYFKPDLFTVGGGVINSGEVSCRTWISRPRSCPPSCVTRPASSVPPTMPAPSSSEPVSVGVQR